MRLLLLMVSLLIALPASAGELKVKLRIPRLQVAEYHRPYVAVWIEHADQSVATQLAVWYQTDSRKEDGTQWLKDLRQWWRRGGRAQRMPIDGVTGATRPAGEHALGLDTRDERLSALAPGKYALVVEAVREVGGRELLKLPFEWPATQPLHASARGASELGGVTLDIVP